MNALLVVDVQIDFCPGGALGVSEGDEIIGVLNQYIQFFSRQGWAIFFSRDWHPRKTKHFIGFGGKWPAHCIQGSKGACFHPDLLIPSGVRILSKGIDPEQDSYSAFQGLDAEGKDFLHLLRQNKITELFIGGLATDYCVRATVLDALREGFRVALLTDAIKGVSQEDSHVAIEEMLTAGAQRVTVSNLSK